LDAIQRAGKNLLVLIDDLLDISRIESGKLEIEQRPFSTFDWMMDVQFITEPLFEEGPALYTTEMSEALPKWLLGDAARLTQIVTNLVSNAAKFTERGEVRLNVGGEAHGTDSFNLVIEVIDSGPGIPQEKLAHIFKPFEQVNPERITNKGVGLGLAISQRLAQAMGGKLVAASKPGSGSSFRMELMLPVVEEVHALSETDSGADIEGSLRVLLVDDDAINRLAVRTLLQQLEHDVVEARHGAEAVEALNREPFDLVLMDVHMPEMDGVTATLQIRAREEESGTSPVPIIGLTASVMNDEKQYYLAAGMNAVVQKPIVLEQLLTTIKMHLNGRMLCEELPA
ncbi:MAG: ATP-binding protein, partial [Candidatus Thiodiazotropha sp.]